MSHGANMARAPRKGRDMFSDEKPGRPRFTIGEVLKVPDGIFGGMVGIVQHVAGSDVWLGGRDFSKPLRLNGLILLQGGVDCAA